MKTAKTAALAIVLLAGCRTPAEPTTGKYVRPPTSEIGKRPIEADEKGEDDVEKPEQSEKSEGETEGTEKPSEKRPQTYVAKPEVPEGLSFQEQALAKSVARFGKGMAFKPVLEGTRCGAPVEIQASATYGAHDDWYSVVDCDDAVSAAHALSYRRAITPFGTIDVSGVAIRHNGDDVWSLVDVCQQMQQREEVCPSDFVAKRVEIKSIVGPIVSIIVTTESSEDRSRATITQSARTLDGRTGQPASLTAMVTEDSILHALKRITSLRMEMPLDEFLAAESLDEVFDLWRTQDFAHFGTYYFADWSAEENRVDMRLLYLPEITEDQNELKELQVWVEPRPKFKGAFEAALTGQRGFYASDEK